MLVVNVEKTGKQIHANMKRAGFTVEGLQKELNLAVPQSIYHWINGRNLPTLDNLLIMSRLFECEIDDLLVVEQV